MASTSFVHNFFYHKVDTNYERVDVGLMAIVKLCQMFHGVLLHGRPYLDGKRLKWWWYFVDVVDDHDSWWCSM